MKRKLFLGIVGLFVFAVCLIRVNAAGEPLFDIGWQIQAATPELVDGKIKLPAANNTYATITNSFDFSKVVFASSDGPLAGKSYLEKIIIGDLDKTKITGNASAFPNPATETDSDRLSRLFKTWFTAYCLNPEKKYPSIGLFNSDGARGYSQFVDASGNYVPDGADPEYLMKAIVLASIVNDSRFSNIMAKLNERFNNDLSLVEVVHDAGLSFWPVTEGKTPEEFASYFMGESNEEVALGLKYIGFAEYPTETRKVFFVTNDDAKAEVLANHSGAEVYYITGSAYSNPSCPTDPSVDCEARDYYPLTGKIADLAFQKYTQTTNTSGVTNYARVLWIVENSYPTLTLDTALSKAGVTVDKFNAQVKALYTGTTGYSDAKLNEYKEMVVYGIVQYAIWQASNETVGGSKLGACILSDGATKCTDEANTSETANRSELNKLYTYLINTAVPNGYTNSSNFGNKLIINAPEKGKELTNIKSEGYDVYGPFRPNYNALNEGGEKIQFTIENNDKKEVKIVDADLKELTELEKNKDFYIMVSNKTELKNIKINLTLSGITTFSPSGNRGTIFNPVAAMSQNAIVGGRTSTMNLTATINMDLVNNPKTGIQNVAMLLLVTLIAFTLGYIVLTYKEKPIKSVQ